MFAGIVESRVPVAGLAEGHGSRRLVLDLAPLRRTEGDRQSDRGPLLALGDSLSVLGVCLTAAALGPAAALPGGAGAPDLAAFDIVAETLRCTNLGDLHTGDWVHVERSLAYGERVHGHLVSGHVEGVGEVLALEQTPGDTRLSVRCGQPFARRCLPKGAVTVDGVGLTLAALGSDRFTVALVPHTLERTTLGQRRRGERVNLEADLIGQWVSAAVAQRAGDVGIDVG